MTSEADGSRSLGLRTKVLPAAMATGNIQQGTMQGKLNGVMPATTPSGWRSVQLSMPRRDLVGEVALEQLRNAAGELHHVDAAHDLALRVGEAPCRAPR